MEKLEIIVGADYMLDGVIPVEMLGVRKNGKSLEQIILPILTKKAS